MWRHGIAIAAIVATPLTLAATFEDEGFEDTLFASGLSNPTAMTFTPDGRLLVAEQSGSLRVVAADGQLQSTPFLSVAVTSSAERGLLGVACAPDYPASGHVYIYYTSSATGMNTISRFTRSTSSPLVADPASELVVLEVASAPGYHNGGAIHFGTDGMLYAGVGDAHSSSNAQSLANLLGKLLRIDPSSHPDIVPADNPFVSTTGARGEIWSYGLRNPFSFAVHPDDGSIYINDVGQSSQEEINLAAAGANFGWPTCEGACAQPGLTDPVGAYPHPEGCAITGGDFYTGSAFPASMQQGYFFADFCAGWIRRLDPAGAMHPFASQAGTVIDIKHRDGVLWFVTRAGQVRQITYASGAPDDVEHLTRTDILP